MTIGPALRQAVAAALVVPMLAGCANHTPVLQLPALEMGHPTFAATVAAYTGSPVVGGNRVEVLLNGDEIFPAKLRAIRSARRTINYAQYVFEEGKPAQEVAQALAERCRAGVTVNVLLDALGALALPTEYRDIMTNAGCRVEIFRPLNPFVSSETSRRKEERVRFADVQPGFAGAAASALISPNKVSQLVAPF